MQCVLPARKPLLHWQLTGAESVRRSSVLAFGDSPAERLQVLTVLASGCTFGISSCCFPRSDRRCRMHSARPARGPPPDNRCFAHALSCVVVKASILVGTIPNSKPGRRRPESTAALRARMHALSLSSLLRPRPAGCPPQLLIRPCVLQESRLSQNLATSLGAYCP